jgi:hypothetical protein
MLYQLSYTRNQSVQTRLPAFMVGVGFEPT